MFSEVVPSTISAAEVKEKQPLALVLSGGPSSVYEDGAPQLDPEIFELGIPIFGICYGFQVMTRALGGKVEKTGAREYGRTAMSVKGGVLHAGLPEEHKVWMSHGDSVTQAPEASRSLRLRRVPRLPRSRIRSASSLVCSTTRR